MIRLSDIAETLKHRLKKTLIILTCIVSVLTLSATVHREQRMYNLSVTLGFQG